MELGSAVTVMLCGLGDSVTRVGLRRQRVGINRPAPRAQSLLLLKTRRQGTIVEQRLLGACTQS